MGFRAGAGCAAALCMLWGSACSKELDSPDVGLPAGSVSRLVGHEGGSLSLAGVSLTIPPGALDRVTAIGIRESKEPVPGEYEAYSRLYSFDPSGLTFARPVSVAFRFAGDPARAALFWADRASGPYERLSSAVSGDQISAPVVHFSVGFAGTPRTDARVADAGAPDAAPSDAGDGTPEAQDAGAGDSALFDALAHESHDAAFPDTLAPDARDASLLDVAGLDAAGPDGGPAACVAPPASPPPGRVDQFTRGWVRAPNTGVTFCLGGNGQLFPFTITEPRWVTFYSLHSLSGTPFSRLAVVEGCAGGTAAQFLAEQTEPCIFRTIRLDPGTYSYFNCLPNTFTFVSEPVPAPAVNTSCMTAVPMNVGSTASGRLLDRSPLYYRFTTTVGYTRLDFGISSDLSYAGPTIGAGLYSRCGDSTSLVGSVGGITCSPYRPDFVTSISNLAPGTYFIEASSGRPGVTFYLSLQPNGPTFDAGTRDAALADQ